MPKSTANNLWFAINKYSSQSLRQQQITSKSQCVICFTAVLPVSSFIHNIRMKHYLDQYWQPNSVHLRRKITIKFITTQKDGNVKQKIISYFCNLWFCSQQMSTHCTASQWNGDNKKSNSCNKLAIQLFYNTKTPPHRVWVAVKTMWSPWYTRVISEHFRDKELIYKALYKFSYICRKTEEVR